jgi:membrane protein involved in colicin uptake
MLSFSLQMQHSTLNEAFGNEESSPHPQIREIGVARSQAAQLSAEAEAAKLDVAKAKREEELAIEKAEDEAKQEAALKIKEAEREAELKIEKAKTDAKKEAALKIEKANWEAKQAAADKAQAKLASMAKQGPPRLEIWLHERMTLMSSNARCGGTRLL